MNVPPQPKYHAPRLSSRTAVALIAALACAHTYDLKAQSADGVRVQIAAAIASGASPTRKGPLDHGAAQALKAIYSQNANAPLWTRDGRPTSQAQAVLREMQDADTYGLQAQDYAAAAIDQLSNAAPASAAADDQRWAQFDVKLSAAALGFMSDLHYGRVDPAAAGFNLQAARQELDLAATLQNLARTEGVRELIASVEPPFHHYQLLKAALPKYLKLAQQPELAHLPAVPSGLKPGGSYAGAPALRSLLTALGDLPAGNDNPPPDVFDAALSAGVRAFQQRHGLSADGVLGKASFAALTTPLARRVRQIDLTLERWRWLPPFQTPPIIVNIPQFRLFAFRTTEDRVADILQMDVIVGRVFPRMQTPVFESDMRYVVIRPYWDVPYSITKNEMLPKIRANLGYLTAQRLEIVRGQSDSSPTVPPSPEAIEALAAGQLRLRQQPGEDNALGLIKFMFPNSYNVYLHSTPAHRLFSETVRAFSHGCIRVSDPLALATQVLADAPGDWTREKIDSAMHGTATSVRVNLTRPINVLILYGTALATEAGPVLFFDDIYGYDKKLERQLGLEAVR
jgi:L,D-transpeptidase YcbB